MERHQGNLAVAEIAPIPGRNTCVHPTAVVGESVRIGIGVRIHPHVVIERNAVIHDGVEILSGCYVGAECVIGRDTVLKQSVVIREKTQIGARVTVEAGAVIGSDGFGYAKEANGDRCKIPQIGFVVIEDDVHIGANTTIDRATLGKTVVQQGSVIGELVQVAHNVIIGKQSVVQSHVGICGSSRIGSGAFVGHAVGMVGHIAIGAGARLSPCAGVTKDIPQEALIYGYPGVSYEEYRSRLESACTVPDLIKRITELEKKLEVRSKHPKSE